MKYIFFLMLVPFLSLAQLPDSLLSISQYAGLPTNSSVRDIVVSRSNAKYVATDQGLFKIVDKNVSAEKILDGDFQALCTNKQEDEVWGISGSKIYSLEKPIFTIAENVICKDMIYVRGSLWMATDKGVYKVNLKTNRRTGYYTSSNSKLLSNNINFIFSDPQANLWIGTEKGLAQIDSKGKWKIFEKKLAMESMTYNKEGIWLVTNKEMFVIDPYGRWYPAALDKGLKEGVVRDITTDKDGRLVLASSNLVRYNPYIDEIHSYTSTLGFLAQQSNTLSGDENQDIWIGTESNGMYLLSFGDTKTTELSALISIDEKITCKGSSSGKLSVTAYGGAPPYRYKWNDDNLRGKKLTGISEGNYTVTVTDKNNNNFVASVEIKNPYPLVLKFDEISRISKAGENDGKATVNISGGVPPYTFLWDDESTLQTREDLGAGIHRVTITDAEECSVETEFEIPAEKFIPLLKAEDLAVGQVLRVDKLFFAADSSNLTTDFKPILDEIYVFLKQNKSVVIEIGGHTNNKPPKDVCYRLSTARAKNIAEYLYTSGIESTRISYKGYGKDKPIADNKTLAGRNKNQRVEIKILSI